MSAITAFPKNILVADFNETWNLHIAHLLNRVEYNVFTVTSCLDVLKFTYGIMPHLILLDLRMPL